ncbi:MAG TPA: CinA family protein, partial [Cytophagaceae bacterium]
GYLAYSITSISGSSDYYVGSTVAYQNEIKISQLGVSAETLETYGAVSENTVKEMAIGAREKFGSDIGVATTGLAGPTGGSEHLPVGTIWIGYSDKNQTIAKKLLLGSDRDINIKITAIALLNFIRQTLGKND